MENVFEHMLEKDEKIIKVLRPNQKKFNRVWSVWFWFFLFPAWGQVALALFLLGGWAAWLKARNATYTKRYYAYTNKRILVRKGTIGVDYESLRYKDITSVDVKVGFHDRGLNTGSMFFASPSRPNISVQGGSAPFAFTHIDDPYAVTKEINEYIGEMHDKHAS